MVLLPRNKIAKNFISPQTSRYSLKLIYCNSLPCLTLMLRSKHHHSCQRTIRIYKWLQTFQPHKSQLSLYKAIIVRSLSQVSVLPTSWALNLLSITSNLKTHKPLSTRGKWRWVGRFTAPTLLHRNICRCHSSNLWTSKWWSRTSHISSSKKESGWWVMNNSNWPRTCSSLHKE